MAKLQKSVKQQQQRQSRPITRKLTPAEIRALNYEANRPKQPSNTTKEKARHRTNGAPEVRSDKEQSRRLPRSATVPLPPTYRSSDEKDRRDSSSSRHYVHHAHLGRSATAELSGPHGNSSRTSSVSSYRSGKSLQTYRGHEMTQQTGGHSMLHRPKQEIVSNPLSMFSRPRQSQLHAVTSPDKFTRDYMDMDPSQAQAMLDYDSDEAESKDPQGFASNISESPTTTDATQHPTAKSYVDATRASNAAVSPPPSTRPSLPHSASSELTVNPARARKAEEDGSTSSQTLDQSKPNAEADHNPPEARRVAGLPDSAPTSNMQDVASSAVSPNGIETAAVQPDPTATPTTKAASPHGTTNHANPVEDKETPSPPEKKKRFSFHHVFDKKDKAKLDSNRQRRRTLPSSKSPEDLPKLAVATSEASPEYKQPMEASEIVPAHPAVRPLSPEPHASPATAVKPSDLTPITTNSDHTYGRCDCCGKVRKPNYSSDLSPVLENENLRTNFSFEAERASHEGHRRYTSIIPMPVMDKDGSGSIRTVQASIEPRSPQSSAASMVTLRTSMDSRNPHNSPPSTHTARTSTDNADRESMIRPSKRHTMNEPAVTRFASLRARRGSESDVPDQLVEEHVPEEIVQSRAFVPLKPERAILGPSEHELQRQRLLQAKAAPMVMSGAIPKAPHPLRQSSPVDEFEDDQQSEHSALVEEAQHQEVKRIPKQDIITVIPITRPQSLDAAVQDVPPDAVAAQPAGNETTSEKYDLTNSSSNATVNSSSSSPTPTTNKLKKRQPTTEPSYPPSSFPTSGKKARRFSLPNAFRSSSSNKRASNVPIYGVPYSSSSAGTPPDTDPSNKPALSSQTSTARTSFHSAVTQQPPSNDSRSASRESSRRRSFSNTPLARLRQRSRSTSREPVQRTQPASPVDINKPAVIINDTPSPTLTNGSTAGTIDNTPQTGNKTIRPSPSFAKFIAKLPASHAKDAPEPPRRLFGLGVKRHTLPPTISETDGPSAPKIELNGSTIAKARPGGGFSGGRSSAQTSVGSKGSMTPSLSLPALKFGEPDGEWESNTIGLMSNGHDRNAETNGEDFLLNRSRRHQDVLTASPVDMQPAVNGQVSGGGGSGFVGGRKLAMLLRQQQIGNRGVGEVH